MIFKNIWVLDDRAFGSEGRGSRELSPIFPNAQIRKFEGAWEAINQLESTLPNDFPEIIFFDAYGFQDETKGYKEFREVLSWFDENKPDVKPQHIFFISADFELAQTCKRLAIKLNIFAAEQIYAISSAEQFTVSNLLEGRSPSRSSRSEGNFEFNRFMNKVWNKGFPTTSEEMEAFLIDQNLLEPEGIISVYNNNNNKLDAAKVLNALVEKDYRYPYSPHIWEGVSREAERYARVEKAVFQNGAGASINGYAAFTIDEAISLKQDGKAAILIVDRFEPQWYGQLANLDGLVVMQSEIPGHLTLLAESFGTTILIQASSGSDIKKYYEFLEIPQSEKPLAKIVKVNDGRELRFIYGLIEEAAYDFIKKYGYPDEEDRRSLVIDKKKLLLVPTVIASGDEITLNSLGSGGDFYKGCLPLTPPTYLNYVSSIPRIFRAAATTYCRPIMRFKANVDALSQVANAYNYAKDGIGLLRTEHLAFVDSFSLNALKAIYLDAVDQQQAYETLKERQKIQTEAVFDAIQERAGYDERNEAAYPVRIRLLDAPPEEVLSNKEYEEFSQKIPTENQRGVQLGLLKPELYINQLDAIFNAYASFKDKPVPKSDWASNNSEWLEEYKANLLPGEDLPEVYTDDEPAPKVAIKLEIMVPTIKTLDELMAVKEMTAEAAQRYGVPANGYRYPSHQI